MANRDVELLHESVLPAISHRDKFYSLDMLILVYKNLSDKVNKSSALLIMDLKKNK